MQKQIQILQKHPSIYEVTDNSDGTQTYTRVSQLESSPYYRWDNSVLPKTQAFPPGFRMIASTDDQGSDNGGERGGNMFTECCQLSGGGENCVSWERLNFPSRNCDFLGIAFGEFIYNYKQVVIISFFFLFSNDRHSMSAIL